MRLRSIALVLGFAALAQTGCKSCHCADNAPPPPPPIYPVRVTPAPVSPLPTSPPPVAPAVGAMLPANDPDVVPAELPLPPANPTAPASFNRLTSWSR